MQTLKNRSVFSQDHCRVNVIQLHQPHVAHPHHEEPAQFLTWSLSAFCFPGPTGGSAPSHTPCSSLSTMKSVSWSSDAAQEVSPQSMLFIIFSSQLRLCCFSFLPPPSPSLLFVFLLHLGSFLHPALFCVPQNLTLHVCVLSPQAGWNGRPTIKDPSVQSARIFSSTPVFAWIIVLLLGKKKNLTSVKKKKKKKKIGIMFLY